MANHYFYANLFKRVFNLQHITLIVYYSKTIEHNSENI